MSIWSNLKSSIASEAASVENEIGDIASGYIRNIARKRNKGELVYVSNRAYSNALVFEAKRESIQAISNTINSLYSNFEKGKAERLKKKVEEKQSSYLKQVIKDGEIVDKNYGYVECSDCKNKIMAVDAWGNVVKESLMLYYISDTEITYKQRNLTYSTSGATENDSYSFKTKYICHVDTAPKISVQSGKNIILTQVQGRNFTRKELVSGGDYTFQVTGEINSNEQDVYPDSLVKKFVNIMEYNGILSVNNILFNNIGINKVLVKDWSLQSPEYKNIQPYSFTCVAVEPDEDIIISEDTINIINTQLSESSQNSWYKLILNNKLASIAESSESVASSSIASLIENI